MQFVGAALIFAVVFWPASLPAPTGSSPLELCPWSKLYPDADSSEHERLVDSVQLLRASPLFQPQAGASAASQALGKSFQTADVRSEAVLAKWLDAAMKQRGWSPELRGYVLAFSPQRVADLFTRHEGNLLKRLDEANQKYGATIVPYLAEATKNPNRLFGTSAYAIILDAIDSYPLPVAEIGTIDLGGGLKGPWHLNKGTGNSSYVYRGKYGERDVAIKIQKVDKEDFLVADDMKVLDSLKPYGAPSHYGMVRVRDERGYWRPALAIEIVPGKDLLTLRLEREAGRTPSLVVTDKHVAAFRDLIAKIERDHVILDDIQPGDFMLTPDGRVVPLDMKVRSAPRGPGGTMDKKVEATLRMLREHLQTLETLAKPA